MTDALVEMQNIYDDAGKEGYTVDQVAYENAQEQLQQGLIDFMLAGDGFVGETDVFIAEDGTEVPLPLPALERGNDGLPQYPDGSR